MINKELGYYVCNGLEFSSKIEAYIYAHRNNKPVTWMFNDDTFNSINWTVDPIESLDALYDQRARELREKYDYLIISYSGGADSHNLLTSFIRQGLHIDEVLVNTFEKANNTIVNDPTVTAAWNYGAEYKLQIYPRLEEIKNRCPLTKITVADMSDYVFSQFTEFGDESWVLRHKEVLNPSGISRYNYLHIKDIRERFDKQKSIALVLGAEKPSTFIRNGEFNFIFFDRNANITPVAAHYEDYDNTTVEYFYWHPDSARMIVKQAHTIKRWLEANPQYQELWTVNNKGDFGKNNHIVQPLLRHIIYPGTWNDSWFQVLKGKKFWHDEIDAWFHKSYFGTKEHNIWLDGIKWVKENAASLVDPNYDSLETCYKIFRIGTIKSGSA